MKAILVPLALLSAVGCSSIERPTMTLDPATRIAIESLPATNPTSGGTSAPRWDAPTWDAPKLAPAESVPVPAKADDGIGRPYTKFHLGWFDPMGDLDRLDNGYWADITVGRRLLGILAIEGTAGYFEAGVPIGDNKVWGVPVLVNARVTLPIPIVEPYVGAGGGGIFAEYPGSTDFVWAWDALAGVGVGFGDLQVGAEYRYLKSEETDQKFTIEGQSVSVFASLPF